MAQRSPLRVSPNSGSPFAIRPITYSSMIPCRSWKRPRMLFHDFGRRIGWLLALNWIWAGVAAPAEKQVTDRDRQFWAFRPLADVFVPATASNPIDAILFSEGKPNFPEAPRRVLIRRLYFDLLGLPPTPEETIRFENDPAPDAYEQLVDQTLCSRHFGERWGRHWLDVARYADSDGYESDLDRREAWLYRDWIVRSLNDDLPFDTFIKWQIAGDELAPTQPDAVIATGFLAAGPTQDTTPADTEENKLKIRYDELDDMVSTTGAAFLGLTLGCARCHDHKFDPIPTRDYYRLTATFSTAQRQVAALSKPKREFAKWREDRRNDWHEARMSNLGLTEEQKFWLRQPEHFFVPVQTKLYKEFGDRLKVSDPDLRQWLSEADQNVWDSLARAAADAPTFPSLAEKAYVTLDQQAVPLPQYLLGRGSVLNRREPVTAGFLQVLMRGKVPEDWLRESRPDVSSTLSNCPAIDSNGFVHPPTTHQRTALACWLTDIDHGAGPLVARVIVNRLWQHHWGEGLVKTPSDFGYQSDTPTHPQLLEWLAGELVRKQWHFKSLHRLIVLSAAYRQADGADFTFARHPLRLESEVLRDSMLAVSGRLNRKMFGPPFRPVIPKEAIATRTKDEYPLNLQESPDLWRRSIYAFNKRSVPNPMMEVFDAPDSSTSCARRNVTTIPTQALTLINQPWVRQAAIQFAQRVITEAGTQPEAQIERAYRLALARSPSPTELGRSLQFLGAAPDARGDALPVEGLTDLCHVLFTLNEFIYVD